MIGLVIVSHSATLAEGVCDLARQVAGDKVMLAAAGGTNDPASPIGTDPSRVLAAIELVCTGDGVLVLMDLGSAVLSAEMAVEMLDENKRPQVRLCAAALVEGAVAAAAVAAAGAELDEVVREASLGLAAKAAHLGGEASGANLPLAEGHTERLPEETVLATVVNPLGLHARPAARLVRMARKFRAKVKLRNISGERGPADAASINSLLSLGAHQGDTLELRAVGDDAAAALAEIGNFVGTGLGDTDQADLPQTGGRESMQPGDAVLTGIPASPGIAVGPLVKLRSAEPLGAVPDAADSGEEERRLLAAIRGAQEETRPLVTWAAAHAGANEVDIFDAQLLFLEDPELVGEATRMVREDRASAAFAWDTTASRLATRLAAIEEPYLRARAADIRDVASRVMRRLTGAGVAMPLLRAPSILAAHDLAPSEVKELDSHLVLGLCLETGAANSHSMILARAIGIPALTGLGPALQALPEGSVIAMDGGTGGVWTAPELDQIREFDERRRAWLASRSLAQTTRTKAAVTRDGQRIRIFANISGVGEAATAVENGADGVGVLRTEFLFLDRSQPPGEEEQAAAYKAIAGSLRGLPLVVRTLDVGGDKSVPYIEIGEERNPFLGWRGIRLTLDRRDLLLTQIRAILRAGADCPMEILLPMVSSLSELRQARATVAEAEKQLAEERHPFLANARLGVMIETPAAVAIADHLAREAAFFSVGSNDLIQYVMVADRTNARVASLADPFQPAVLRMLRQAVDAAKQAGIGVTLCGELAADPLAMPLLIGLGLEELSVSAPLVAEVKLGVATWSAASAREIAREAQTLQSSEAVRRFLAGHRPFA
jgi:phosphocarrier protein FPr